MDMENCSVVTENNDGLAVRLLPLACDARVRVRDSTLDHETRSLSQLVDLSCHR